MWKTTTWRNFTCLPTTDLLARESSIGRWQMIQDLASFADIARGRHSRSNESGQNLFLGVNCAQKRPDRAALRDVRLIRVPHYLRMLGAICVVRTLLRLLRLATARFDDNDVDGCSLKDWNLCGDLRFPVLGPAVQQPLSQ